MKGFRGKWLKRVEKVLWKYDDDRATNEFFDCAVKFFQTNVIHEKGISPPRHLGSQIVTFNLHVAQLLPQVKNRKFFEW